MSVNIIKQVPILKIGSLAPQSKVFSGQAQYHSGGQGTQALDHPLKGSVKKFLQVRELQDADAALKQFRVHSLPRPDKNQRCAMRAGGSQLRDTVNCLRPSNLTTHARLNFAAVDEPAQKKQPDRQQSSAADHTLMYFNLVSSLGCFVDTVTEQVNALLPFAKSVQTAPAEVAVPEPLSQDFFGQASVLPHQESQEISRKNATVNLKIYLPALPLAVEEKFFSLPILTSSLAQSFAEPFVREDDFVPKTLLKKQLMHNPHVDTSTPSKAALIERTQPHPVGQYRVAPLVQIEGSVFDHKVQQAIPAQVLKDMSALGITLEQSASGTYVLNGIKGRQLEVPFENLALLAHAMAHNDGVTDVTKLRSMQRNLQQENARHAKRLNLKSLSWLSHLFGARPECVETAAAGRIRLTLAERRVVRTLARKMYVPKRNLEKVKKPRILLHTAKGGGGHAAQTKAIEHYLVSKGFKVKIVNMDSPHFEPLGFLTLGKYQEVDGYNKIHQQRLNIFEHRALREGEDRNELAGRIHQVVKTLCALTGVPNRNEILKAELQHPDYVAMIDSFPFVHGCEGAATDNGLPCIRWATDFDIWQGLLKTYQAMDPARTRVALTSRDAEANAPLLHHANANVSDPIAGHYGAAARAASSPADIQQRRFNHLLKTDKRVHVAGYPIRAGIKKLPPAKIERERKKIGLTPTDRLVTVMMGSQGKAELAQTVTDFLDAPPVNRFGKTVVAIGVGSNFQLKGNILECIARHPNRDKINFQFADELYGVPNQFMDAGSINSLLNCSDLLVSKPGGSVSAEILETQTPILMCHLNDGEFSNAQYLVSSGLGAWFDPSKDGSIGKLAGKMLNNIGEYKLKKSMRLPSWQAELDAMLVDLGVPKRMLHRKNLLQKLMNKFFK